MVTTPIANPQTQPYHRDEWAKGYRSLKQEHSYWIEAIEGEIPLGLKGTVFRNGPGMLDINGTQIQHPFDGDGMICAITFDKGRAHFRNRYVRTEGYVAEQQAGKVLYRGVFGTQRSGGWLANAFDTKLKNIANTQVIYWGGKLLALWEAAVPHRLDPTNLETLGLEDFDGQLQPEDAFAAHPWIDPASQFDDQQPCLVNFSVKAGLSFSLNLYELSQTGQFLRQQSHIIPGFAFIHDFAITPNYAIFFQNPVRFNPLPFLLGARGAGECIQFQPQLPTKILVIRRGSETIAPQVFETKSGFVFHHANAFEQDGKLTIDSICYADLPAVEPGADFLQTNFEALQPGQLWRFQLDLASGQVDRRLIQSRCCEFPVVHPALVGRPYRYAYMGATHRNSGNEPLQAIAKVNVETGEEWLHSFAPHGYVSEPVFVPRTVDQPYQFQAAEDEGWIITLVYDGSCDRSSVVILDARDLSQVARLQLQHHVPYGLHGTFTPTVF
jgi:all-trans-8'-apo-beta-carotenal 15,15'-oxygenase